MTKMKDDLNYVAASLIGHYGAIMVVQVSPRQSKICGKTQRRRSRTGQARTDSHAY